MDEKTSDTPILINRYMLEKTIGSGGMAVVYLAQDLLLERKVAVKVLRKDFSQNKEFQNNFKAEAKAIAKLSHHNIVVVHDFGFDAGRLFIVMEFVEGTDLKTMINNQSIFHTNEAIQLISQACEGLGYAHNNGIVHCDIKPHNFIISKQGLLKITDFGIARALETIQPDEQHESVWGSPQYFSPEQSAGKAPSPASDVYSLGVILFEMVSGQLPFISEDANELAQMHRSKKPPIPQNINQNISNELNKLILRSLEKDPKQRFLNAHELGRELNILPENKEPIKKIEIPDNSFSIKSKNEDTKNKKIQKTKQQELNWTTILLSLLALITVGGLIPFWLYIWLTFNSIGR